MIFSQRAADDEHAIQRADFGDRHTQPGHDLRIGGTVRLDQPDAFARLLERSFGVRAQREHDTIVLDRAP